MGSGRLLRVRRFFGTEEGFVVVVREDGGGCLKEEE